MAHAPQSASKVASPEATRVVVIGDAASAEPYLAALAKLRRVLVTGFVDRSAPEHRGADGTRAAHLRSTRDPATAAEWDDVDAFIHCAPLARDPEPAAVVATSGKPVFVDSQGGRQRSDARTVRACIEAGEIGRVVFARFAAGNRSDDASASGYSNTEQLQWQQRAHVLDMLGWWIGDEADTVFAQRNHDHESVTVRYVDGATAVCDISTAGPSYREIVVIGTTASMSLSWADHTSVLLPADGTNRRYVDGAASLDAVLDEWLVSVRAGTAPVVDALELTAAVALDEAVELSVTSGRATHVETSRDDGSHA
jgi:predicted dehydrogenase